MKLLARELNELHVVSDLRGDVISFYKLRARHQSHDIERVAKRRYVNHDPQQREMNHERGADEPRKYCPSGVAINLEIFEQLCHP